MMTNKGVIRIDLKYGENNEKVISGIKENFKAGT